MPNYLFAYIGGDDPQSEAEGEAVMQAWTTWLGSLGDAAVQPGNPTGASLSIAPDGTVTPGAGAGLAGYSVIAATDLDDAAAKASGCPHLVANGTLEIYETIDVM